ncbi:hypothetical protein [Streptomyces sp. NPDC088246]
MTAADAGLAVVVAEPVARLVLGQLRLQGVVHASSPASGAV